MSYSNNPGWRTLTPLVLFLAATVCLALSPAPAHAGPVRYRVTDLGLPRSVDVSSLRVNARGDVLALAFDDEGVLRAYVREGSALHGLDLPDLFDVGGINDRGQVVGTYRTPSQTLPLQSFIYEGGGVVRDLTLPGSAYALAINNAGQILGRADEFQLGAIVDGDRVVDLGPLRDAPTTRLEALFPTRLNNSGQVAGTVLSQQYQPFFFDGTAAELLLDDGSVSDLTDAGVVLGSRGANDQGFIYEDDVIRELPGFAAPLGVNAAGRIVGTTHAFDEALILDEGVLAELEDLLAPGEEPWDLRVAYDVNDAGQIVATGLGPEGTDVALLLTPVPDGNGGGGGEPNPIPLPPALSAAALVLAGLGIARGVCGPSPCSPR